MPIADDFSRSTWTQLLTCKSNTLQTIKTFVSLVENQFQTNVKTTRTDNGSESLNTETIVYVQDTGIIYQKTGPYTPQQNGVVERKYKHILEVARALLYQSKLPNKYWGECILTATYLINKFLNSTIHKPILRYYTINNPCILTLDILDAFVSL